MNPPRTVPAYFQAAIERLGDRPILEDRAGTVALSGRCSRTRRPRARVRPAAASVAASASASGPTTPGAGSSADLAIQLAGAVGVPRGTDTPEAEILEIFRHAEVAFVVVQDARTAARFEAVRGGLTGLREVDRPRPRRAPVPGVPFDRLVEEGRGGPGFAALAAALAPDDVSTIIYTSGTTGRPKGVVLTQGNFAHQLEVIPAVLDIGPTDVFLSVLPPWHIFERTVEYVALTQGARLVYTDVRRFRNDLAEKSPTFVPSVPRIWEAVHDAIRKTLAEGPALRRAVFASAYAVADTRARAFDVAHGWSVDERGRGPGLASRGGAAVVAGLLWPFDALLRRVAFRRLAHADGREGSAGPSSAAA